MRNGGLRKVDARFDIASAEADVFINRTGSAFLKRLQDFPPGRVGDGMQYPI